MSPPNDRLERAEKGLALRLDRLTALPRPPAWATLAFKFLCFVLAGLYIWHAYRGSSGEIAARLHSIRWGWVAAAAAVLAAMQMANAAGLRAALAGRRLVLGIPEALRITLLANFHSLILPFQAGWGTRAVMLKDATGLGFKEYVRMSLGMWAVLLVSAAGLGALAWLRPWDGARGAAAVGAAFAMLLAARLSRIPRAGALLFWSGLDVLLGGLRYRFLFLACGSDAGLPECVFMGCFSIVAPLLAPVPGALGVLESSIVFGSRLARLPADAGLAVALLNRVLVSVAFVAFGAGAQFAPGGRGKAA